MNRDLRDARTSTRDANAWARRAGARDALGVPAAVVAAGMLGFGALALEAGIGLTLAALCTAGIWALPGQMVLIEMHMAGAPGVLTLLAVVLTAARFLPMSISLMPILRTPASSRGTLYAAAHLVAMTSWAWTMRRCADMPREARLSYFIGFGGTCWAVSVAATIAGYYLAGSFPPIVRLGFVFLNPVYFVVLLIGEARTKLAVAALVCGAVAGPLAHLVNPQWSVLLAGVAGGSVAYLIQRAMGGPRA
ncbi:MAG TPA: AzlC family ABC transporter permease [Burkholderiales bacterium]|nr:AzlC family ABC transporter permease [Burkholderiales bacterium]